MKIKQKLIYYNLTIVTLVVIGVICILSYDNWMTMKRQIQSFAASDNTIVATMSAQSLIKDDPQMAVEMLKNLYTNNPFDEAYLIRNDNKLFVEFIPMQDKDTKKVINEPNYLGKKNVNQGIVEYPSVPGYMKDSVHRFLNKKVHYHILQDTSFLEVYTVVNYNKKPVGVLLVRLNWHYYDNLRHNIWIGLQVFFWASILAIILSSVLASRITRGLNELVHTFMAVKQDNDYTRRFEYQSDDEIGQLADGFNSMLNGINERDAKLAKYRNELEIQVENRTRDLTETIEKLTAAKLEAFNANQAKSQFLANMSHELRTPMNAIIGYTEMIIEDMEDSDDHGFIPDLKKVTSAAKHLLNLINDILDISKVEARKMVLNFSPVNKELLLQEINSLVHPMMEKNNVTFTMEIDADLPEFVSDEIRLKQCLVNLLSNAAKFSRDKSVLFNLSSFLEGGDIWIRFSVQDTGIGMTEEQQKKLFKPFSQASDETAKNFGGTGLGLYLSKCFIEMMGGRIYVSSVANQGSTFTIELPAKRESRESQVIDLNAHLVEVKKDEGKKKVLVVDDEPEFHELIKKELKDKVEIIHAYNGKEGFEMAEHDKPDLIVLDAVMPIFDGWKVISMLKANEKLRNIPVVMLTVSKDRELGLALGATDFLNKPIDTNKLVETLRKHLYSGNQIRVLVVDDDLAVRESISRSMKKLDWIIDTCSDGIEALAYLKEKIPSVILLDLLMPRMDGFQFLATIRENEKYRNIPVVVFSSKTLDEQERAELQQQSVLIVSKDLGSRSDLIASIKEKLDYTG